MELGSAEHKQLLQRSIYRTSKRIASIGIFIGVLLLIPSLVRDNSFSQGLAYAGWTVLITTCSYAAWLAYSKYQRLLKNFDQQFNQDKS